MSSVESRSRVHTREQVQLSPLIASLDIGASKITCFVARSVQDIGPTRVLGVGSKPSRGVKNGNITDLEAVEKTITQVFESAEAMAGIGVSDVVVSVSGFGMKTEHAFGEIIMPAGTIGEKERRRVVANAMQSKRFDGRHIIHVTPVYFKLDGNIVKEPLGMVGRKLEVVTAIVTIPVAVWNNIILCVTRTNRHVVEVIAAPYAASLSVLADDELESGALVVEMGAKSTTAALFQNGALAHVDAVPIGSDHITQDISQCFETSAQVAEKLKIAHGSAIASLNENEQLIDIPHFDNNGNIVSARAPRSLVTGIVRPRVEETLELLRDRLSSKGIDRTVYGRRIVLAGGGAQLNGVRELAARVFEGHVRVGRPQRFSGLGDAVSGPAFAVCAGLLRWGIDRPAEVTKIAHDMQQSNQHPILKAMNWVKEVFW